MNIQAIRLFLHIVRRGSLASAAEQLHMSPSAASRVLSGLERTTGLKLFSREGQRLRPTVEGEQYYQECQRVLIAVDELPHMARRLASGAQSRLHFFSGSRLAGILAIPAIARFTRANPHVIVDFEVVRVQDIALIRSGRSFDIALGAPVPTGMSAIAVTPLFEMPTMVVMRRDHELAKRTVLRMADLAGVKLIATAMGQAREDLDQMFDAQGLETRPQYTCSSIDVGCAMALATGAVIIADPSVLLSANRDQFAVVPLKPSRPIQVSMVTPSMKADSRAVRDFKACLREEAGLLEKRLAKLFSKSRLGGQKR